MQLSLSLPPSPIFSLKRPHQIASSYHQRKITIEPAAKFVCPSSKCSQILPPNIFYNREGCSKLAPNEFHCAKAIPVRVASKQDHAEGGVVNPESLPKNTANIIYALRQFIRPPVMLGLLVEFLCVLARTRMECSHLLQWPTSWSILMKAFAAYLAIACSHLFINGVNQIFDIEIDKVNKPYLPLASGGLSPESAWMMVISLVATGFWLALVPNSATFFVSVCCLYSLGAAYSIPPLRLKASTFGAPFLCSLSQGFVTVFSMYAGARAILGLPYQLSLPVAFLLMTVTSFAFAMGFMKDIADMEGDIKCNVPTLASMVGPRRTAFLGIGIVLVNYLVAIVAAVCMPQVFEPSVMIPTHILMALGLIFQVWQAHKANYAKVSDEKTRKSSSRHFMSPK